MERIDAGQKLDPYIYSVESAMIDPENSKEIFLLRMKKLLNKQLQMNRVSLAVILRQKKRYSMTK